MFGVRPDLSASFLAHGRRHACCIVWDEIWGEKSFLLIFGMYRPATPFSLSVGISVRSHSNFLPFSGPCQKCEIEKHGGNRPSLPRQTTPLHAIPVLLHSIVLALRQNTAYGRDRKRSLNLTYARFSRTPERARSKVKPPNHSAG